MVTGISFTWILIIYLFIFTFVLLLFFMLPTLKVGSSGGKNRIKQTSTASNIDRKTMFHQEQVCVNSTCICMCVCGCVCIFARISLPPNWHWSQPLIWQIPDQFYHPCSQNKLSNICVYKPACACTYTCALFICVCFTVSEGVCSGRVSNFHTSLWVSQRDWKPGCV